MTSGSRMTLSWPAALAAAVLLLAIGAGALYLMVRPRLARSTAPPAASTATASAAPIAADSADLAVTLTPDAIERAGIVLAAVTSGTEASALRLPGLVEPNAYKQVAVTPLVA